MWPCACGPFSAGDAELTMRSLGTSTRILVANPQLASRLRTLDDVPTLPTLATLR